MRSALTRFFFRASRLFGVPEMQARLDSLHQTVDSLHQTVDSLHQTVEETKSQTGTALSHVDRRTSEQIAAFSQVTAALSESVKDVSLGLQTVGADLVSILERINAVAAHVENRIQSLNTEIVSYVDESHQQQLVYFNDHKNDTKQSIIRVRESVDSIRRELQSLLSKSPHSLDQTILERPLKDGLITDSLYVTLEDHFRGSRDLVTERQGNYLKLLPTVITAETPIVDLGCGRGEWLSLLKRNGIPAVGVDSNAVCVLECNERGLNVQQDDLLSFVRRRPDSSVGTYTLFQVLEHLPFDVLVNSIREIRRTLVPGGRLIAEVPNAKNLRVSAGTFWIDPTHERPLYPELLEFLATETGFSRIEGLYVNDQSPKFDLTGLPDEAQNAIRRILDTIDTAQDYALIATS